MRCVISCPQGAIKIVNGYPEVDKNLCRGCGICLNNCPFRAISLILDREEVLDEIKRQLKQVAVEMDNLEKRLDSIRTRR
ncbi:MAG: 4Fe-4S binding protein [Candidatus Omnitrophica bacterium]|nr:4Fe-4S binding protein [Candidatus Omnitrophota bacterium]